MKLLHIHYIPLHYYIYRFYLKDWQAYKIVGRDLLCLNYNSLEMFIVLEDLIYVSTVLHVFCIWKIVVKLLVKRILTHVIFGSYYRVSKKSDPKGDLLIIILPYSVLYINRCFLFFFSNTIWNVEGAHFTVSNDD